MTAGWTQPEQDFASSRPTSISITSWMMNTASEAPWPPGASAAQATAAPASKTTTDGQNHRAINMFRHIGGDPGRLGNLEPRRRTTGR